MERHYDVVGLAGQMLDYNICVPDARFESVLEKFSLNNVLPGSHTHMPDDLFESLFYALSGITYQDFCSGRQLAAGVSVIREPGNDIANSLAAMAEYDLKTAFLSAKGVKDGLADPDSELFSQDLLARRIDSLEYPVEGISARVIVITTPGESDRRMLTFPGVKGALTEFEIPETEYIFFGGYEFSSKFGMAIRRKISSGEYSGKVAFSLAAKSIAEVQRDELMQFITKHVSLLFCNEEELRALFSDATSSVESILAAIAKVGTIRTPSLCLSNLLGKQIESYRKQLSISTQARFIARERDIRTPLLCTTAKSSDSTRSWTDRELHEQLSISSQASLSSKVNCLDYGSNSNDLEYIPDSLEAVVTRGKDGSCAIQNGQLYTRPAVKVEKVVSTVGAGDAFSGVYLANLLKGAPAEECLSRAAEYASRIVQIPAARLPLAASLRD